MFKCTTKVKNHPLGFFNLTFKGTHNISHCLYCQCYPKNTIDCFIKDKLGVERTICKNCTSIYHLKSCPCLKIASGRRLPPIKYWCIDCQCSTRGQISCAYDSKQQCSDQETCKVYLERLKNNTVPYQCNSCLFNGKKKLPRTVWRILIRAGRRFVKCNCKINGEVECTVQKTITDFTFKKVCSNCSTQQMIENAFRVKGMLKLCFFLLFSLSHIIHTIADLHTQLMQLKQCDVE